MITLEQLLLSRDRRASKQRSLLEQYPSGALLCLTVQLPGAQKRSELSLEIASVAVDAVRASFEIIHEELTSFEVGTWLSGEALPHLRESCALLHKGAGTYCRRIDWTHARNG